ARRRFLQCLAGGAALGLAPRRLRAGPPSPLRRLVIIMQNNGTQQGGFWPRAGAFTSPILDGLLANPRLASRTTLVRGLYVPRDPNGTGGNEQDMGFARMWTGARLMAIGTTPWGGAPSVDQLIARAQGLPSLNLAVYASAIQPFPKPGFQHRRSFCYAAP